MEGTIKMYNEENENAQVANDTPTNKKITKLCLSL